MKKVLVLLLAGLLMIGCSKPQEETKPSEEQTSTQAETESESESETETEAETESETEKVVEIPETSAGEVIMDSYYQHVNASWQDTYLAVLFAVQLQQEEGTSGPPYFALMKFPGEEIPMMICGNKSDPVTGYGHYRLYGYEDNKLFELCEMNGIPTIDLANNTIALDMDGSCYHYIYREQNLVRIGQGGHLQSIPMTQLYDVIVTIDNLESFLLVSNADKRVFG